MRLHNALASFGRHFDDVPQIKALRANYGKTVCFDFGDCTPVPDDEWRGLQIYAMELLKVGKFELPFQTVAYSFIIAGMPFCVVADQVSPDIIRYWTLIGAPFAATPLGAETDLNIQRSRDNGKCSTLSPIIFAAAVDGVTGMQVVPDAEINRLCANLVQDAMALTVMLHADGVVRQTTPAPAKLNARRAKSGKLPISAITEIRIKIGNTTAHASGVSVHQGHRSPRFHWRRGHIRHLPSGEITTVRPCLVGAVSSNGATPAPKNYNIAV